MILTINAFNTANPQDYDLPDNAREPRFIYRVRNFVNGAYFQYPGATAFGPTPVPDF